MKFEYFKILWPYGLWLYTLLNLVCQFTWNPELPLLPTTSWSKSEWQSGTQPRMEPYHEERWPTTRDIISAGVISPIHQRKFHRSWSWHLCLLCIPCWIKRSYRNGQIRLPWRKTKEPEIPESCQSFNHWCAPYTPLNLLRTVSKGQGLQDHHQESRQEAEGAWRKNTWVLTEGQGQDWRFLVSISSTGKNWETNVPVYSWHLSQPQFTPAGDHHSSVLYNQGTWGQGALVTLGLGLAKKTWKYVEAIIEEIWPIWRAKA